MAITDVNEQWAKESINQEKDGRVEVRVGYQFISDSIISSTIECITDLRFPYLGQFHPQSDRLIVVDRRITRIRESRQIAEGEVVYSTRAGAEFKLSPNNSGSGSPQDQDGGEVEDDPIKDRPIIEWIPVEGTRVAELGRLKNTGPSTQTFSNIWSPITNSAGQPYYDPPVEIDDASWMVLFRRNEEVPIDPVILAYLNVVNSDTFTIGGVDIEQGEALMKPARIGPADFRGGKFYVPVTYDIRLRPGRTRTGDIQQQLDDNGALVFPVDFRGWEIELQDRGYHYLDGNGDLVRAVDDGGDEMVEPVFLDGSGGLADSASASPPRVYKVFFEKPFSIFNFE